MTGALHLIPVPIAEGDVLRELSPRAMEALASIRDFYVENQRTAKRFLAQTIGQAAADEARFYIVDKSVTEQDIEALLPPLLAGADAAVLSEAGSPCVADPGALLVRAAARHGVRILPYPGPSAILMAIMASGLGGQSFTFNGYLPADEAGRSRSLRELEARSRQGIGSQTTTQAFIETPYRNTAMLEAALKVLASDTLLCVAYDLSGPSEAIWTKSVADWKANPIVLGKAPAVFLILSETQPKKPSIHPDRDGVNPQKSLNGSTDKRHLGRRRL